MHNNNYITQGKAGSNRFAYNGAQRFYNPGAGNESGHSKFFDISKNGPPQPPSSSIIHSVKQKQYFQRRDDEKSYEDLKKGVMDDDPHFVMI